MFATQTRRVFQPRYFRRLKINLPLFFGLWGLRDGSFMIALFGAFANALEMKAIKSACIKYNSLLKISCPCH